MSKVTTTTAVKAATAGVAVGRRAGIVRTDGTRLAGRVKSISTDSITVRRVNTRTDVTVQWAEIAEAFQFERFAR